MTQKSLAWLLVVLVPALPLVAQHEHHGMQARSAASLQVQDDAAAHILTLRLGPLNLPAHADHAAMAQPAAQFLTVPFDGWITAYHPRLVDDAGKPLPSRLLHHVAFGIPHDRTSSARNRKNIFSVPVAR